ncbi:MAG: histidine phosphatase family protein [Dehalococcoidia bacterium]
MGERRLILVRHGAYDYSDRPGQGRLNDLGRRQAEAVADLLGSHPIDAVHVSTLVRAEETAEAISLRHPGVPVRRAHLLRECVPPVPDAMQREFERRSDGWPDEESTGACAGRLDRAYARYFTRTRGPSREEVLVAHGNAIRYLVARAIGADARVWLTMDTHNCGVTEVRIDRERGPVLVSFNETGHLPAELRTL